MRVEVTGKPSGISTDNGKLRFLLVGFFDRDRVTVPASFTDIRYTENYGPAARLDGTRKISIARDRRADHDVLRAAATPAAESGRSAQSEINDGATILPAVIERDLQALD